MLIRMLETRKGSPDGRFVHTYREGQEYELPDSLARAFVRNGWAKVLRETKPAGPDETKPAAPAEVKKRPTKEGSPYYVFEGPDGLYTDGEGKAIKVLGSKAAERKREEFQAALEDEDE